MTDLRRFSVVHHVARRVGEVLEDQRTQVHAAGWSDAGAGEEYYLESYLTFEMSAQERGDLIDKFNRDEEIFIFILSTRAGSYAGSVSLVVHLSTKYDLLVHNLKIQVDWASTLRLLIL